MNGKFTGEYEVMSREEFERRKAEELVHGGAGSGHWGHAGRPGEVGGSSDEGAPAPKESTRSSRAKATYKPADLSAQREAHRNEASLARSLRGKRTKDNEAFDVIVGKTAIEVKTIVKSDNDKITMHRESLARKVAYAKEHGLQTCTVVFDKRSGSTYFKEGVGSFRLSTMTKIGDIGELKEKFS